MRQIAMPIRPNTTAPTPTAIPIMAPVEMAGPEPSSFLSLLLLLAAEAVSEEEAAEECETGTVTTRVTVWPSALIVVAVVLQVSFAVVLYRTRHDMWLCWIGAITHSDMLELCNVELEALVWLVELDEEDEGDPVCETPVHQYIPSRFLHLFNSNRYIPEEVEDVEPESDVAGLDWLTLLAVEVGTLVPVLGVERGGVEVVTSSSTDVLGEGGAEVVTSSSALVVY